MHDAPRQALLELIQRHGPELIADERRLEGLLRDHAGSYRGEITALVAAVREGVPRELLEQADPLATRTARLAQRLQDNLALTPEAAHWAVAVWAEALGVSGASDLPLSSVAGSAPPSQVVMPRSANRPDPELLPVRWGIDPRASQPAAGERGSTPVPPASTPDAAHPRPPRWAAQRPNSERVGGGSTPFSAPPSPSGYADASRAPRIPSGVPGGVEPAPRRGAWVVGGLLVVLAVTLLAVALIVRTLGGI